MDTPDSFDSPPRPTPDEMYMVIERLRIAGLIAYCLAYTIEAIGKEYSPHIGKFSDLADYIGDSVTTSVQVLSR
jgi:hypothetical protein